MLPTMKAAKIEMVTLERQSSCRKWGEMLKEELTNISVTMDHVMARGHERKKSQCKLWLKNIQDIVNPNLVLSLSDTPPSCGRKHYGNVLIVKPKQSSCFPVIFAF